MELIIIAGPPSPGYEGKIVSTNWAKNKDNQLIYLPKVLFSNSLSEGLEIDRYLNAMVNEMIHTKRRIMLMGLPRGTEQLKLFIRQMDTVGITAENIKILDLKNYYSKEWEDRDTLKVDYCSYANFHELLESLLPNT